MLFRSSNTYKKKGLLGEGLNSVVYKAVKKDFQTGLTHTVALKLLKSKTLTQMWKKEFESLSMVDSSYCISVLGWHWDKDQPGLLLEYVEGVSLKDIYFYSSLDEREILYVLNEIHKGLLDLKEAGIFHGDLSLSNVLLNAKSNIKLIDFGLGGYDESYRMLTPDFTAPEILSASMKPDYLSDLYSLSKISEFLRSNRDFKILKKLETQLQSQNRNERKFDKIDLKSEKDLKEQISLKIKSVNEKKRFKGTTRLILSKASRSFSLKKIFISVPIFLLAYCLYFQVWKESFVSVRTHKWVDLRVNFKSLSTPLYKKTLLPGLVFISWKSKDKTGFKFIPLKGGQHIVLGDSDFF